MNICVYGASSKDIGENFLKAGHELGYKLAKRGHGLVFGGGDTGMMGASARGTRDGGGHITGIAPSYFNVDGILYQHCDDFIYTDTMRERKHKLEALSDGFVVSPGGIGTFEEFFEVLTLKQLGKLDKPIAMLNTNGYFNNLIDMLRHTADKNFMSDKNFELFYINDDIDSVLDYLENPNETTYEVSELRRIKLDT